MFPSKELSAVEMLSEVMKVCLTRWRSLRITRPPLLFPLPRTGTMSQMCIIISSKELSAVKILSKITKVCFSRCRSIACICPLLNVELVSLIREDNQVHGNEWLLSFTYTMAWLARPCVKFLVHIQNLMSLPFPYHRLGFACCRSIVFVVLSQM